MLLIQLATTHALVMKMTRRVSHVRGDTTVPVLDSISVALSRLHRAFAMQVDALANLPRGGRQKVTVEHVHVHPVLRRLSVTSPPGGPKKEDNNPMQSQTDAMIGDAVARRPAAGNRAPPGQ